MKAKATKQVNNKDIECIPEEATHILICIPSILKYRRLPVQIKGTRKDTGNWTWNGDINKPTLKPSILSKVNFGDTRGGVICHSFITNGKVQFLNDCSHTFAGRTMDLLDVDI